MIFSVGSLLQERVEPPSDLQPAVGHRVQQSQDQFLPEEIFQCRGVAALGLDHGRQPLLDRQQVAAHGESAGWAEEGHEGEVPWV